MRIALDETLRLVAAACVTAHDPWWLIGSAAVALHGAPVDDIADVDVLMSLADADALLRAAGVDPAPGIPDARFRSLLFGTWRAPPLPVEVMAGLDVAADDGWRRIAPETRIPVALGGETLFVPARDELGAILTAFGRPKDLERARLLRL
jgi:hypothetical protein